MDLNILTDWKIFCELKYYLAREVCLSVLRTEVHQEISGGR